MNHTFHCHLRKSLSWYHNWHSHPRHQHTHWLLFLILSILTTSVISGQVGDFYNENNILSPTVVHAQTGVTGTYQFSCPAGYVALAGSMARASSWTQDTPTLGIVCDDDGVFNDPPNGAQTFGVTYPTQALLVCGQGTSGVAFTTTSGPCNSVQSNPASRPGWRWDPGTMQPNGVNIMNSVQCGPGQGNSVAITLNNANFSAGAWTTSPDMEGLVCIRGTLITTGSSVPTLTAIDPNSGAEGDAVVLSGLNLDMCEPVYAGGNLDERCNVMFFDANGTRSTVSGIAVNSTTVMAVIASGLCAGPATVAVGSVANPSNTLNLTITSGTGTNCPGVLPPQLPIINDIQPRIVSQGQELVIYGEFLTDNVQFIDPASGLTTNVKGWVTEDNRVTRVIVPTAVIPGFYNIGITGSNGSTRSSILIQVRSNEEGVTPTADDGILPQATNFTTLIGNVFTYAVAFVGIAVFIMILYGGFLWMTSAANPGNISRARSYISNAIIGAILLLSAYVILYTINPDLIGGTFTLEDISVIQPPSSGGNFDINPKPIPTGTSTINVTLRLTLGSDPQCSGTTPSPVWEVTYRDAGGNINVLRSRVLTSLNIGTQQNLDFAESFTAPGLNSVIFESRFGCGIPTGPSGQPMVVSQVITYAPVNVAIGVGNTTDTCSDLQQLAQQHNNAYYGAGGPRNAPELDSLIGCIRTALPGQNLGTVFGYDQSNPTCNYTRGDGHCDPSCSHTQNSCHYGGSTGTQGAQAVDFGNEAIGDQIIQAARTTCAAYTKLTSPGDPRCESSTGARVACTDPSATHVHINSVSCDRN